MGLTSTEMYLGSYYKMLQQGHVTAPQKRDSHGTSLNDTIPSMNPIHLLYCLIVMGTHFLA